MKGDAMEENWRRCAGMDVHKDMIEVHVLAPDSEPKVKSERRTFRTFTGDLIQLRTWLVGMRVTEAGMESTGVYWQPVWRELEGHVAKLILANPAQVKALQGRKSDRRDAKRIAEFVKDGRLDSSFVPPPEFREMRELLRHRVNLLGDRNRTQNRIHKVMEGANLKFAPVASDLFGATGRGVMAALVAGEADPDKLALMAMGKLKIKGEELRRALRGNFTPHNRFMLKDLLEQLESVEARIAKYEGEVATRMKPHEEQIRRLRTIPGVDLVVAWTMVAELGVDMDVFPDAAHCASWAGLCPGENESAGKRHSTRTKRGNRYLRRVLVQAGWANSRRKKGYLKARFHRIAARKGQKKAAVAVGHKILVCGYTMLKTGTDYAELGEDYFDVMEIDKTARRLKGRLERIGFKVSLERVVGESAAVAQPEPGAVGDGGGGCALDVVGPSPDSTGTVQPQAAVAAPPAKRKRGRPCKCAERGIACTHRGQPKSAQAKNPEKALVPEIP